MNKLCIAILSLFLNVTFVLAFEKGSGTVKGFIFEKATNKPLEFANVVMKKNKDSSFFIGAITDKNGLFFFECLNVGEYKISYSYIGFDETKTSVIVVDSKNSKIDLDTLYISETTKAVDEVEVVGQKSTFVNSIDRKTFNVGQDVMSKSGSVSDLMQNIPSVHVDVDGNVSLRGSENVTILVNGKFLVTHIGQNISALFEQQRKSNR